MAAVAGWLYISGKVGFDGFLLPVLALLSSFGPVSALASLGTTLQNTVASGARVLAILEEEPETEEITGQEEVEFHGADCRKVTFGYGRENVLSNFSLSIHENQIIGIVGESGCGKSTLLKLLMRFWDVNKGSIEISDKDIRSIPTSSLRKMEAYVTQSTVLFHDSIANNLRIANPEATDEQLEEACRKASIHDFIASLPQGYDTPVGELGDTLSGGERQRLGLARAFLHGSEFLLLDEPTSNLDALNEAMILKTLKEEAEHRTILLVSHRQSTLHIADEKIQMHTVE
jgi:ATP-binding cassette subfamily C protein